MLNMAKIGKENLKNTPKALLSWWGGGGWSRNTWLAHPFFEYNVTYRLHLNVTYQDLFNYPSELKWSKEKNGIE